MILTNLTNRSGLELMRPTSQASSIERDVEISCDNPYGLREVELRSLKQGEYFYRKPKAKDMFIRNHYNRKDQWNSYANFSCTNDRTGYELFLKPSTKVWID